MQAVVEAALLVGDVGKITFGGEIQVKSPHNIRGVLQQKAEKWITDVRLLKYEGILLESPKLKLEVTSIQNPAQFLYGEPLTENTRLPSANRGTDKNSARFGGRRIRRWRKIICRWLLTGI